MRKKPKELKTYVERRLVRVGLLRLELLDGLLDCVPCGLDAAAQWHAVLDLGQQRLEGGGVLLLEVHLGRLGPLHQDAHLDNGMRHTQSGEVR